MIFGDITVGIIDDFLWFICFGDDTDSWAPGPNCPGPNLLLFRGGQLGPRQLGPGAQFAIFQGRTVGPRGPTVRGPICHFLEVDSWAPDNWAPGPNCPGPNLPLFGGGQLGPGQLGPGAQLSGGQLSGAQLSGAQFA